MTVEASNIVETGHFAAFVMAAGRGERLAPLTKTVPKCLARVGDTPVLDRWYQKLLRAEVAHVFINTHHLHEQVAARVTLYNDGAQAHWHIVHEPILLGTARTLFDWLSNHDEFDQIAIIYADNVSDIDLLELFEEHSKTKAEFPVTVAIFHAEHPASCGIALLDQNSVITEFVEKPLMPVGDLANTGVLVADVGELRKAIGEEDEDLSRDVLPKFCGRMRGVVIDCYHKDYGTPEQLEQVTIDLLAGKFEKFDPVECSR